MSDEQPQRPIGNDPAAWHAYWQAQGMTWRTEPDIDEARQVYLAARQAVKPDIEKGIYPFRDENGPIKLTRSDVEWLLATHEGGRGPVDWGWLSKLTSDERPRARKQLDLRGANLIDVNLRALPLTYIAGGLNASDWNAAAPEQREFAAAHFEKANLFDAHLEAVTLYGTHFEGATLNQTRLERARLTDTHLEGASLFAAHLEGANLTETHLERANLIRATLDKTSHINRAVLTGVSLDQVTFDNVNLTVVNWNRVPVLGDELTAKKAKDKDGKRKDAATCRDQYAAAVRANRVLAVTLRGQGMNEDADRYAYRAQVLQRAVLRRQRKWGRAFGSWLLDRVSGYGYKPMRSVWAYVGVILAFAAAYFAITNFGITPFLPTNSTPLVWYEALILSISSFHGRGQFPNGLSLGDPVAIIASAEAIIGLLIEITFIATFTQRFFAR